jgi:uncharacterized membrane protein YraQ (UPF0718 family)
MNILKKAKEHLFFIGVAFAYLAIFAIKPQMGIASINNSGYYIKEMLMIMPVIFVLTALLDMWIPKEKIQTHLGDEAGVKGVVLSLLLGSVSAGPIYAAFPLCIMLLSKGASIKNIVIILSSWAVVKIPMLLNEVVFLGLEFMITRYVLTIIAIIAISLITAKVVKKSDIPIKQEKNKFGLNINSDSCMGCSLCAKNYPVLFYMENKKAHINNTVADFDMEKIQSTIDICPVKAIEYFADKISE